MSKQVLKKHLLSGIDYIVVMGLVIIGLLFVLQLWRADLAKYPLQYGQGDDMTAAMTIKTIQEEGWFYTNPLLGAPNVQGTNSYDATTGEVLLNLLEKICVMVTNNWVLALNIFYLLGYVLVAWSAYFVLKHLGISRWTGMLGAVLYAFLPYHFFRNIGHLYLSEYFMVPLMVYYVVLFMRGETVWKKENGRWLTWKNVGHVLIFGCMGLTGVYYAYFACFFLCVSIGYKLLNQISWKRCRQELAGIGMIAVSLILAVSPSLIYWLQNGRNSEAVERSAAGAEIYSMKLVQLILPISGHRISKLADLRSAYDSFLLSNENTTVSLGLIMSLGFLILLFSLFIVRKQKENYEDIRKLSILNLAALLIGTVGSFSSIIGFLFSLIRCYNRICIYIAMFSVITICLILDRIFDKWKAEKNKKILQYIVPAVLLCIGIWDQTSPAFVPNYDGIKADYDSDEAFVKQIENIQPEGMIFQMPYVVYPEQGAVNNMVDYSHLRGYLHSDTLRWSYCAVKGRETDQWQRQISQKTLEEQLVLMREQGFTGIYIDTYAYTADELSVLQAELKNEVGDVSLVSENGRLWFYILNE